MITSPEDWPWRAFADPAALWAAQPSFVLGQLLFVACALLALAHAVRAGRANVLIWLAALVAGTANDFIFMALPLVDNFWQAQGLVMLTPRMPLYIPCVYVCFMYFPTAAVRGLGLGRWQTFALSGLLACLFYAPYDIVGARFLWWTWHDTDGPIAARILGAPTSSSLWVLTFVGAFSALVDRSLRGRAEVDGRVFGFGLLRVAALTTLIMMVQMTVLQQVDGGSPAYGALATGLVLYGLIAALGGRLPGSGAATPSSQKPDLLLAIIPAGYFLSLLAIGLGSTPEAHVSVGVHQEVGECYVEAVDITGLTRHQFLCASDFDEEFDFSCAETPTEGATWYTVCGTPHEDKARWGAGLTALGVGGVFASWAVAGRRREETSRVEAA